MCPPQANQGLHAAAAAHGSGSCATTNHQWVSTQPSTQLNRLVKEAAIHHTQGPCTTEQTPHGVHVDMEMVMLCQGLVVS